MILFVHSKFIPLNTFVVTVEADWTVSRVRGSILHNLAEIGHQKHPFRLKYKDVYLQDKLTLEECEIYDNTVVELITLATGEELKRDLFYRYIPPGKKPEEPHLKALKREIDIFHKAGGRSSALNIFQHYWPVSFSNRSFL